LTKETQPRRFAKPAPCNIGEGWAFGFHACSERNEARKERAMLGNKDASANIAVRDLQTARKFYEGTLGLKPVATQGGELIVFRSGNSRLNVYRSQYAGTNKATAVTWEVDDIEKTVSELKAKGVTFEHYDLPGSKLEGDVHVDGDMKVAWFKDADGNILNLYSR